MDLPVFLPVQLGYIKACPDEDALCRLLEGCPADLMTFFELGCADEAWAMSNTAILEKLLLWMNDQFFLGRLSINLAERATRSVQKHSVILREIIPKDIVIFLEDSHFPVNGMMLAISSTLMFDLLRRECMDKGQRQLVLRGGSVVALAAAVEFIHSGEIEDLWKKEPYLVLDILKEAARWEMYEMVSFCSKIFQKYLHKGNVVHFLNVAHEEGWGDLKSACMSYINGLNLGIVFKEEGLEFLSFEFINYRDRSLEMFNELKKNITHLVFHRQLIEDPLFSYILKNAPQLVNLDISQTFNYSDRLSDIPLGIQSLNLSMCSWLNRESLETVVAICPHLRVLLLASNTQLDYHCWSLLAKLRLLEHLDLSRCNVSDGDLELVSGSCAELKTLKLEGCHALSDRSIMDLARNRHSLLEVNLSRTKITDAAIIELSYQCKDLVHLNLARCENISDFGVTELFKNAHHLKYLDISHCNISPAVTEQFPSNLIGGLCF